MSEVIQAQWESLNDTAARFDKASQDTAQLRSRLNKSASVIRQSWEGKASQAFDDGGYIAANYHRYDEMAAGDSAHIGERTPKTERAAGVALSMEGRGQLEPPITRPSHPGADAVDAKGQEWDVKEYPSKYTNPAAAYKNMQKELDIGENIIVDTGPMTQHDIDELWKLVKAGGHSDRVIWYPPERVAGLK